MFKPAAALVAVDWVCHCCGGLEAAVVVEMAEMGRCGDGEMPEVVGDQWLDVVEVGRDCQGWRLVMLERG